MAMDPYAPPRSTEDAPIAMQALPPELEMQAVRVLGEMRTRAAGRAFAVGWLASTAVLMLVGLGLIPAGLLGGLAGGGISKGYLSWRKPAMIEAVSRQLGIPAGLFNPDKYLVD
jgi:hypothetical protein